MFAVQLARLVGARVIGTGSASSVDAWRALGAEPVTYGDGLEDRVRALAPECITSAIDLSAADTAQAARELGVPDGWITSIAAQLDGVTPANGANAVPGAIEKIAELAASGRFQIPSPQAFRSNRSATRSNCRPSGKCTARWSTTCNPDLGQGSPTHSLRLLAARSAARGPLAG